MKSASCGALDPRKGCCDCAWFTAWVHGLPQMGGIESGNPSMLTVDQIRPLQVQNQYGHPHLQKRGFFIHRRFHNHWKTFPWLPQL